MALRRPTLAAFFALCALALSSTLPPPDACPGARFLVLPHDDRVLFFDIVDEARLAQSFVRSSGVNRHCKWADQALQDELRSLPDPHKEDNQPTRVVVLKLATTGSTWFGDLLGQIPHTKIKAEIITGSGGAHMSTQTKEQQLLAYLRKTGETHRTMLVGFSINSKNAATVNFGSLVSRTNSHLVAWVRSNMVKFGVGKWRAEELHKRCHTNNLRTKSPDKVKKCALPPRESIPPDELIKQIRSVSLNQAVHLGVVYATAWRTSVEVFEVFYEHLLQDRNAVFAALFQWLGRPDLYSGDRAPQDKTIQLTTSTLRDLLENFEEVQAMLEADYPCLLPHLTDSGVMPPCSNHFNYSKGKYGSLAVAADLGRGGHATSAAGKDFKPRSIPLHKHQMGP